MPFKLIKFDKLLSELKDSHALEENLSKIVRDIEIEFDFQSIGIFLFDDSLNTYRLKIGRGLSHSYEKSTIFHDEDELIKQLKNKKSIHSGDFQFEYAASDALIVALYFHKNFFGFIFIDKKEGQYDDSALSKLCMFSSVCSMVINIFKQQRIINHLAEMEEHTKIYSQPAFYKYVQNFLHHSKRYNHNLTLCLFNFGHYQKILNTYGKDNIKQLEIDITNIIKHYLRQTDIIGRSASNFIAIAMPETDIESATIPIKRIMEKIDNLPLMKDIKYAFYVQKICTSKEELPVIIEKAEIILLDAIKQGKKLLIGKQPI